MPRARCALAMTSFFARNAVQSRAGRPGGRPLRMRNKRRGKTGRCGERTERCRWQRKRSERVAAVKILSVRRKAAQKFWAPQQDHRPLRKRNKRCNGRATARVAPTEGYKECLAGGRTGASAPTGGVLMVPYAAGHMGPALQGIFVGQGPRALPGVREKPGRADVGIGPYGSATRGAMGGRPQGSPLRGRCKGGAGESGIPQSRLRRASPL